MNRKGFASIALIVLVVVLAGVAGYFALNNRSTIPTPTPSINEQPIVTPSPTPTGWQFIDANHIVTYETIGGYRAKIVIPKVTGNGTTGVYFGDLGGQNRFSLSGSNLTTSQQETALKIFRTIKFKK